MHSGSLVQMGQMAFCAHQKAEEPLLLSVIAWEPLKHQHSLDFSETFLERKSGLERATEMMKCNLLSV